MSLSGCLPVDDKPESLILEFLNIRRTSESSKLSGSFAGFLEYIFYIRVK